MNLFAAVALATLYIHLPTSWTAPITEAPYVEIRPF